MWEPNLSTLPSLQVSSRNRHACSVFWWLYILPVAAASPWPQMRAFAPQRSPGAPGPEHCLGHLRHPGLRWQPVGRVPALSLGGGLWQCPPWAAAVSSGAKREAWIRPHVGSKSLRISQPLELYHPAPSPKLGLFSGPERPSAEWPSGKELSRTWGTVWASEEEPRSQGHCRVGVLPPCVRQPWARRSASSLRPSFPPE